MDTSTLKQPLLPPTEKNCINLPNPAVASHSSSYGSSDVTASAAATINRTPLGQTSHDLKAYKRRWWIILVFSFCSMCQSIQWNTWSPVIDAVKIAYGWSESFVTLFPASSIAGFLTMAFPMTYIVKTRGLRTGAVIGVCAMTITMSLWNFALALHQNWLIVVGSVFNGIATSMTLATPPLLSVLWFPENERTKATAIAAASGYMGTGISFLTGPFISGPEVTAAQVKNVSAVTPDFKSSLESGILNLVYFDSALTVAVFLSIIIYFPDKPPKSPSAAAETERLEFWQGLKKLFGNWHFLLLNVANIPNGSYNTWLPLVSITFRSIGISEASAGWIGFFSIISGCLGSILVSAFVDRFKRRIKLCLQILCIASIITFAILVSIQEEYIHIPEENTNVVLYTLCIFVAACINGAIPLFYELGCELAYPVHEGLTCTFMTVANNILGMVYFFLFLNPTVAGHPQWLTWLTLATCTASLPLLTMVRPRFHRLDTNTAGHSL